jgi:hypothetical protein
VPKPAQQRPDGKMTKLSCWGVITGVSAIAGGLTGMAGFLALGPWRQTQHRHHCVRPFAPPALTLNRSLRGCRCWVCSGLGMVALSEKRSIIPSGFKDFNRLHSRLKQPFISIGERSNTVGSKCNAMGGGRLGSLGSWKQNHVCIFYTYNLRCSSLSRKPMFCSQMVLRHFTCMDSLIMVVPL